MEQKLYILYHENKSIPYSIVRTKRKTIGIRVEITGEVKISAPYYVDEKHIIEVVRNKSSWIIEKLNVAEKVMREVATKQFVDGEKLLYLGKEYELKIEDTDVHGIKVMQQNDTIRVHIPKRSLNKDRKQFVKETLILWYKKRFSDIAYERIKKYSSQIGSSPNKVVVKEQKTRWGSCSSKGNINLNWRLAMAPISIIDYVIVHELCHLKVMNHSKEFWKQVELILPDYIERREWLKVNGSKLFL